MSAPQSERAAGTSRTTELAVGIGCLLLGMAMAVGAIPIPSEAGYQGVGANFLPWLVSIVLMVCGGLLTFQAVRGGWSNRESPEGAERGDVWPFVWVSAALLLIALLITKIGFILSCTLGFVVAVRGFHLAQGQLDLSVKAWVRDIAVGFALCAPVFWLFAKVLNISLPSLITSGWI